MDEIELDEFDLDDLDLEEFDTEQDVTQVEEKIQVEETKETARIEHPDTVEVETTGKGNTKKADETSEEKVCEKVEKVQDSKTEKYSIKFVPDFDISTSNLDTKTYQVRKTKRRPSDIEDLKSKIELQGQVEPVQIAIINGKNFLIAGEGRVLALRQLDRKAKALVYTGLSNEEIIKISTGSNESRLQMTEWDRICSIGLYYDKNKNVTKYDPEDPNSLSCLFGLNKSSIYSSLKMWDFYRDKKEFHDLYSKYSCPLYVIMGVSSVLVDYQDIIDNYTTVTNMLSKIIVRKDLNKKMFTNYFMKDFTEIILSAKNNTPLDINVGDEGFDSVELNRASNKTNREIKQRMAMNEQEEIEKRIGDSEENRKRSKKANALLDRITNSLEDIINNIQKVDEIEDFHKLVHSDKINKCVRKVSKINEMVTVLI